MNKRYKNKIDILINPNDKQTKFHKAKLLVFLHLLLTLLTFIAWIAQLTSLVDSDLPSMYIFMLAWLVMGFMGILRLFGFGEIANFAHLGGLASGIFFAMILVMYKKTTLLR